MLVIVLQSIDKLLHFVDSHVHNRLEFEARYYMDCILPDDPVTRRDLLVSSASHTAFINTICGKGNYVRFKLLSPLICLAVKVVVTNAPMEL